MLHQALAVASILSGNEVGILQYAHSSRSKISKITNRCCDNIKTRFHYFPL